jgi:heme/copper-type cytochrome/quinol oxidase subunit 3
VRAVQAEQPDRFLGAWRWAIVLGLLFAAAMTYEWLAVPFSGQYSNVFRLMVGFHGVHALVIGAFLIRVYRNGRAGHYNASHYWPVEGAAGLWHFVTIAWIMFYVVLFVI